MSFVLFFFFFFLSTISFIFFISSRYLFSIIWTKKTQILRRETWNGRSESKRRKSAKFERDWDAKKEVLWFVGLAWIYDLWVWFMLLVHYVWGNLWDDDEDDEERDEIILVLMIYGFGLCWVCNVFEEIYGMRRKMTKLEMGCFGLCWVCNIEGDGDGDK